MFVCQSVFFSCGECVWTYMVRVGGWDSDCCCCCIGCNDEKITTRSEWQNAHENATHLEIDSSNISAPATPHGMHINI